MKRFALLLALASPVGAQIPNLWEGEAMVGLSGQNDRQKLERVQLSPVGLNVGFIAQPIFSRRNLSVANQVSFFPSINYDQPRPFDTLPPPSTQPLIMNTAWVRVATSEPEAEGRFVFFGGAGVGLTIATPREGTRVSPVVGVGMRRWFARQMGFEVSLQCSLQQLGRTACQLPVTSLWPFGGSKTPGR
jgi:hypothetical protein